MDTYAVHVWREASTFYSACSKFNQKPPRQLRLGRSGPARSGVRSPHASAVPTAAHLFLLNFLVGGRFAEARNRRRGQLSAASENDGTGLLTSGAAPNPRLRFATDRHNSATAPRGAGRRRGVASRPNPGLPENHVNLRVAEGLGSGWRFFATYARVQTSTVLRQPSRNP
jgi:hypothetical protein